MENAGSKKDRFVNFREHARLRIPIPFACSISKKGVSRWFAKDHIGLGVVYDVSMKGARVSSEAPIKPGDQVMVTLQLPKQLQPLAVERATVRWAKHQTFGLEFMHLTFTGALQLKRFIALYATPPPCSACATLPISQQLTATSPPLMTASILRDIHLLPMTRGPLGSLHATIVFPHHPRNAALHVGRLPLLIQRG